MMKKVIIIISVVALGAIMHRCAVKPIKRISKEVSIRVGIMERQDRVEVLRNSKFDVNANDGTFLASGTTGDRFIISVRNAQPAEIVYRLLVQTVSSEEVAKRIVSEVEAKGFAAVIKQNRRLMARSNSLGLHINYYVFLDRSFINKQSAENYQHDINYRLSTTVKQYIERLPVGTVVFENVTSGQRVESQNYLRVSGSALSLKVKIGTGFHFEDTVDRSYSGNINFVIDRYGQLTIVNEIPLDIYLSSVVASEMNPKFPLEALKAQAVTARSYTMSKLGKQHQLAPYDLCDDVHCQTFSGVSKITSNSNRAVKETSGEVLMYENEICETFYHAVCGGHTEHNENIWQGAARPYLRGVFDLPPNRVTVSEDFLLQEDNMLRWIQDKPRVYCDVNLIDTPSYLEYTKKYFRWQIQYSQSELKELIRRQTGHNVGTILNIIPMERGVSGRIKKLRIIGNRTSITIEKDSEIRNVFSPNYLYSSCFIIEKQGVGGTPHTFIIKGAGWGHGIGMCQTGAAVMAINGKNYKEILNHYYAGTSIKSIF